jgi:hypothetical protein
MGQAMQFILDQRQEPVERGPIAVAPSRKQWGDLLGLRFRHNSVHSLVRPGFLAKKNAMIVAARPYC